MSDKTEIVQARDAFATGNRIVRRGETFHAGHPVVRANPDLFEPFRVENTVEDAAAGPGVKRGGRKA